MQERLKVLEIVEALSVLGSIGGSIASVVTQQVIFASIPLSLSVTLNLVNRRLLLGEINQTTQLAATQIVQENVQTQAKLGILTEHLAEVQQLTTDLDQCTNKLQDSTQSNQFAVTQIMQENVQTQAKLGTLTEHLAEVQQLTTDLNQRTNKLQDSTHLLRKGQTKLAKMAGYLREVSTYTQTIRISPNHAKAYYKRGITYEYLKNKQGAIGDYTEAIRINPSYAEAYYNRSIAYAALGDKKQAVKDLREAAKLFFEEGNIAKYQIARELSKNFHELSSQSRTDTPEKLAVECLFS